MTFIHSSFKRRNKAIAVKKCGSEAVRKVLQDVIVNIIETAPANNSLHNTPQ